MASSSKDLPRRGRRRLKWCGHCLTFLPYSTFIDHKARHFDLPSGKWKRNRYSQQTVQARQRTARPNLRDILASLDDADREYFDQEPDTFQEIADESTDDNAEIWDDDENDLENESQCNEDTSSSDVGKLLKCCAIFLMAWKVVYNITDNAVVCILNFLKALLALLAHITDNATLRNLTRRFPDSLHLLSKILGIEREFTVFAICPSCGKIYPKENWTKKLLNGRVESQYCVHVAWPYHPHSKQRQPCGAALMKQVRAKNGDMFWYPKQVYSYYSVTKALAKLLSRNGIMADCEKWRSRCMPDEYLADIYDGSVWKKFRKQNDDSYFAEQGNYGVILNVDWFRPHKFSPKSIGAIYLVLANLPRQLRYQRQNIMLIGMMDGEPRHDLNFVLEPLVNELLKLWEGQWLYIGQSYEFIRVALICVACDIPAARKVGGFLGHSAIKGCSKCLKEFQSGQFGEGLDYSGFDRNKWPLRTDQLHRRCAGKTKKAASITERRNIEKETGAKWSVLYNLVYYDTIEFVIVDPMHNICLGTAKHCYKLWRKQRLLTDEHLSLMQQIVNEMIVPPDIGKIPRKIECGFSDLTAEQWLIWIVVYSSIALHQILPREHLHCWLLFVDATRLICSKTITKSNIDKADNLLLEFCKKFETLYGKESCTPNIHMHLHLADCIRSYGPVYAFWCFSFERYNGILGNFHNNNHNLPTQLMEEFLGHNDTVSMTLPSFGEFFDACMPMSESTDRQSSRSRRQRNQFTVDTGERLVHIINAVKCDPRTIPWSEEDTCVVNILPPIKTEVLEDFEHSCLTEMYNTLYRSRYDEIRVPKAYMLVQNINLQGSLYESTISKRYTPRCCYIRARWRTHIGGKIDMSSSDERPGIVQFYLRHVIEVTKDNKKHNIPHVLANVSWYQRHPNRHHFADKSLEVWCRNLFEPQTEATFLPVSRISGRFAPLEKKITFEQYAETVLIVNYLVTSCNV